MTAYAIAHIRPETMNEDILRYIETMQSTIDPFGGRALAARRPGWTVEFWEDRCAEHERASGGLFAPPAPDRAAAPADVRDQALERWAGPRGDVRARLVAALPHATIGQGFGPAVSAEQAAAARAAVRRAYAAAVGT
ncbi:MULTISPECIES: hypothetical protein [Streptomyces]|uniref:Uncharacterized protein n=1 Tax=Streptomyces virginiae TaxID=1961 RepID=A0ABZ1TA40_STRVG|nr:hypothetical protein [Streptomyces virginiae]WTB22346.1 hypothetical protein OG253_13015 [Streptomyces virginiae]